jgi:hypothetical protein
MNGQAKSNVLARHLFPAACLTAAMLLVGCAESEPAAVANSGLELWFASLTSQGCAATTNGQGVVPATVTTLAAVLTRPDQTQETFKVSKSTVQGKGSWLLTGLPIGQDIDLELFGCDASHKVVYSGRTNDVAVVDQAETVARVFLAPVAQLACTGGPGGSATLKGARSLAGAAALFDGQAVVAGGIKEWSSADKSGTASSDVDVYDYRLGAFRPAPSLLVGRIQPHVHALPPLTADPTIRRVLVAGGVTSVKLFGSTALPSPLMAPGKVDEALPPFAAEVVELSDAGQSTQSTADIGVGARPLSSSIHLGSEILFAGGVDDAGAPLAQASRLPNLTDVAAGIAVQSVGVTLAAARARPALLKFPDGTVVVWGGNASKAVADLGEVLEPAGTTGKALTITGDAAILTDANLATIGPVAVVLASSADTLAFLVAGGLPYAQPIRSENAPTYVVVVSRASKSAEIKPVDLGGSVLRAGLGTVAIRLPSGHILFAGGLVAPMDVPDVCSTVGECILDTFTLIEPSVDVTAATVVLTVTTGSLGQPSFGMAAAPLPTGALLAGGQLSVSTEDDVLDAVGQVFVTGPSAERQAVLCGP